MKRPDGEDAFGGSYDTLRVSYVVCELLILTTKQGFCDSPCRMHVSVGLIDAFHSVGILRKSDARVGVSCGCWCLCV